jgi:ABC-type multidrug transport system ATPase subunit
MNIDQPAIQVSGLSKSFAHRRVLDEIELRLFAGEIVALMGANGAGKTSLLRCLASTARPDRGEVCWFGGSGSDKTTVRRHIGLVAHESQLYPRLTVRENLIFAARMCDVDQPGRHVDRLLRDVGLQASARYFPRRLSQGMRQRISLLRGLVHNPRIVLLDEPFSSLDAEGRDWFSELMIGLRRRERMVCFATHDEQIAWRLSDRLLHLQAGKLTEVSTPGIKSAHCAAS